MSTPRALQDDESFEAQAVPAPPLVVVAPPATGSTAKQKRQSLLMILLFTVLSAGGQVFMKLGANQLKLHPSLVGILTNFPLLTGLGLYGVAAVLMILALRHGELSVLYPLISLSYVWVAVLSVLIFDEVMNIYKVWGVCLIMIGVVVLGMAGRK